jgi:hypothetical protein
MKKTYKDIMTIQKYIAQKEDILYRKPILDVKTKKADNLQTLRLKILKSMKSFETNLFEKSKNLFIKETKKEKDKRTMVFSRYNSNTGIDLNRLSKQIIAIKEILDAIEKIEKAQDISTLTQSYKNYIYLKKQFE